MNDGSDAGSLYVAAADHLSNPVWCFVYSLYFHIFMAPKFKLNVPPM